MNDDRPRSRRTTRISAEEKSGLKAGMQKLYPPARDDEFRSLLKSIDKASRKK